MFYFFSKALKFLIEPTTYLFLFPILVIFFCFFKKKYLKIVTIIYAIFFLSATSPISFYLYRWLEQEYPAISGLDPQSVKEVEAAVVLSGDSISYNTNLGQFYFGEAFPRLMAGLRLLQAEKINNLIITKGNNLQLNNTQLDEGNAFLKLLDELRISKEKVILLDDVLNTFDEAKRVRQTLESKNIKSFYLITNSFHLKRAMLIFEKQGLKPIPYPVGTTNYQNTPRNYKWSIDNLRSLFCFLNETIGIVSYRLVGYI